MPYHLYRHGLLQRTISCRDTACFYWFSPRHVEQYQKRRWVPHYESVDQVPHEPPAFNRWNVPDFQMRYQAVVNFGFDQMILPIFNKYNHEWNGPPVNYLTADSLLEIARELSGRFQLVYFRPTTQICVRR